MILFTFCLFIYFIITTKKRNSLKKIFLKKKKIENPKQTVFLFPIDWSLSLKKSYFSALILQMLFFKKIKQNWKNSSKKNKLEYSNNNSNIHPFPKKPLKTIIFCSFFIFYPPSMTSNNVFKWQCPQVMMPVVAESMALKCICPRGRLLK